MNESAEKSFTTQVEETFRPLFADNWCQTLNEVTTTDFEWNIPFPFLEYPPPSMKSSRFSSEDFCFWTLHLTQEYGLRIRIENQPGANNTRTGSPAQVITGIANIKGDLLPKQIVFTQLDPEYQKLVFHCDYHKLQTSEFYEKEGNVTIYCTVKLWSLKETKSGTSLYKVASDVCHKELVLTQLEELFKNKSLSDVKLIVGGRTLHAHKIILSARSKVFTAMFEHETAEKLSNKVDIRDIDPDVFHEVLGYMYTGRMSSGTLEKMAVGVLAVADKYLLDQLKAECETHLINSMSADNCAELLALSAQPHPAMHLKKYAFDFLRRYPSLVMATDGGKKAKEEKLLWWYESIEMLCSQRVLDA
ncbi:speckle-type POZ protein isoform X5 [Daphnia magna]|uniref:speckle-type POZ protein isoform X5 n=1 Tax=Daphnia magna TaxID=35525 RepID=UPI001E1BA9A4|nr:speckle-type POZ protein isoform X5 [Daphnia magna]